MALIHNLEAVLFDLDGTLIKTEEDYVYKYMSIALQHFGVRPTRALSRRLQFDDDRDGILRKKE